MSIIRPCVFWEFVYVVFLNWAGMSWSKTNGRISKYAKKVGLEIHKTPDKFKGASHRKFERVRLFSVNSSEFEITWFFSIFEALNFKVFSGSSLMQSLKQIRLWIDKLFWPVHPRPKQILLPKINFAQKISRKILTKFCLIFAMGNTSINLEWNLKKT